MQTIEKYKNSAGSLWSGSTSGLISRLKSSTKGLSQVEAESRLKRFGPNTFTNLTSTSWLTVLLSQFKSPLIIILLGISVFSFMLGETLDTGIILVMLTINTIVGFIQEFKAQKSLERLRKLIVFNTKVIRDGKTEVVNSKDLVVGDMVILNRGDIVPADIRLTDLQNLTVNESVLTGESEPSEKSLSSGENSNLPQEIKNGLFMGTTIESGYAQGIIAAIGRDTFFGKFADKNIDKIEKTHFEKNLGKFSNFLLILVGIITVVIFVTNSFLGRGITESFLFAVTLALGITPEVLPIIITIALSTSAYRLSKKHVVIRRLSSFEDLGNMTVLCSDKTGTITEGELKLAGYSDVDGKSEENLLRYSLLCNGFNSSLQNKVLQGQIDESIWESAQSLVMKNEISDAEILDFRDFDFEKKNMSVLAKVGKQKFLITKGSTESILSLSSNIFVNGIVKKVDKKMKGRVEEEEKKFEERGYRTIALGYREVKESKISEGMFGDFIFLGFLYFIDPPRSSLDEVIASLERLNVSLKIITGDSSIITKEICRQAGFKINKEKIILGDEVERASDEELKKLIGTYNVFARVAPEHKYRIMEMLKSEGEVVGYIGDGINDIGALRVADIGISVDNAVDVAKDSSDIIMLRRDLDVLANAVVEGRKTFANTFKFIFNTMSSSFGNVISIAVYSAFLKFIPLLPPQVLLIDTLSDFQHLTVSSDNVDPEFLRRPNSWDNKFLFKFIAFFGPIGTIFDFFLIWIIMSFNVGPETFRTIWVVESILSELVTTFSVRTRRWFFKSKPSFLTILISILLGATVVALPFIKVVQEAFGFTTLEVKYFGLIAIELVLNFAALEIAKRFFYRKTIEIKT